MNIALLYTNTDQDLEEFYPLDYQGRDLFDNIYTVKDVLISLGHKVDLLEMNNGYFGALQKKKFNLAFNLCDDGLRNNPLLEPHIPAMLDILDIPYTGAGMFTLASCLDKARTKQILSFHKIPTPRFQVFESAKERLNSRLGFPLIVKPLHEDASIGITEDSLVSSTRKLKKKISFLIENYKQPALVEEFIEGREVNVGILGDTKLSVLGISEIIFDKLPKSLPRICTYTAKWQKDSRLYQNTPVKCPAELPKKLENKIKRLSLSAYKALRCRDYGRVDFRLDKQGRPFVLEVNPNPDISEDAGLFRMAKAAGLSYKELIDKILKSALERNENSTCL